MTQKPFEAFLALPYPCYWLGDDDEYSYNEAAQTADFDLYNPEAIRQMLFMSRREQGQPNDSRPYFGSLLTAGLRVHGLMVLPFSNGLVAVAPEGESAPILSFTSQMRESITNIFAALPLLAKGLDNPDLRYLEEMQANCYDLLRQASNLEIAARLENSQWSPTLLNLAAVADSTFRSATDSLQREYAMPIHLQLPQGPVLVQGDLRVMENALFNLLRNSLQYTRDGNEITVTLKTVGGRALLTVADKGLGIKPEFLEQIYKPYASMNPYGDSNERPGVGLGLAIVRKMAARMGGSVVTESRFGEGTQITLSLPLATGNTPPLASQPADYWSDRYSPLYIHLNHYCRPPRL